MLFYVVVFLHKSGEHSAETLHIIIDLCNEAMRMLQRLYIILESKCEVSSLWTTQPAVFYLTYFVIARVEIISHCVQKFVRLCGFNFKGKVIP